MTLTLPDFESIKATAIAGIQANLRATVAGDLVQPDFSVGSVLLTFAEVLSLTLDAFYGQLLAADAGLRLPTAQGTDLDAVVALLGCTRDAGRAALVPVKFTRFVPAGSDLVIPAAKRVLALDGQGNPTLAYVTVQGSGLGAGVAGVIAAGASDGWAWAQATVAGRAGNVAAGQIALLGDPIGGVDQVGNPQVPTPQAPTIVVNSGSGTSYRYAVAARGVSGVTPASPSATCSGGSSPNNTLSWPAVPDAASLDVLVDTTPLAAAPSWTLLQNVAGTAVSVTDTGQGRSGSYTPGTANTTNTGTGGADAEDDEDLRARAPRALADAAQSTLIAVEDAVLDVPGVGRVFVQDAGTHGQAAGTALLYVLGDDTPMGPDVGVAIASAIAVTKAAGIQVAWSEVVPSAVTVSYTVQSTPDTTSPATLAAPIAAALAAYFGTLILGNGVPLSGVMRAIAGVGGVASVTALAMVATVGGTPTTYTLASVPAQTGTLWSLGTITATIT